MPRDVVFFPLGVGFGIPDPRSITPADIRLLSRPPFTEFRVAWYRILVQAGDSSVALQSLKLISSCCAEEPPMFWVQIWEDTTNLLRFCATWCQWLGQWIRCNKKIYHADILICAVDHRCSLSCAGGAANIYNAVANF